MLSRPLDPSHRVPRLEAPPTPAGPPAEPVRPLEAHPLGTQPALPGGRTVEQSLELELARHPQRGLDVTLGQRALDLELLAGEHKPLAPQRAAHQLHHLLEQMGDVADGLVSDPPPSR